MAEKLLTWGPRIETNINVSDGRRRLAILNLVRSIIQHRWLIFELVKREVKLRYRGTWLGFFWSLLNPLIMTVVYTLVFSFFLRFNIPDYPVFLLCALLPWTWFSESIITGMGSFVDRPGFVRDSIFPSGILPVTFIAASMMNYVFSLPILLILLLLFKVTLSWTLIILPLIMVVQFLFSLGIVLILATFNVFFRDLRYIIQNLLMAFFFLTPIMYDFSVIPARFHWIFKINPMAHLINDYRSIFIFSGLPDWRDFGIVFIISLMLVFFGSLAFERHRERFAEYL